jgi:ParB/RepB/Spo0J family partition protein
VASKKPARNGPPLPLNTPEFRHVETGLLLEPMLASRETMDEARLAELIDSISKVGLIEPLVVKPEGPYYRILAGHRRFVSCKALGFTSIPCIVRPAADVAGEAVTAHENAFREDLNPAEEAKYFSRLLETQCGGDTDKLAELVRYSRERVEGRLLLLQGDQRVFEELGAGRITLGVARELNMVQDAGLRLSYLDAAVRGGASIQLVREWRIKANAMYGEGIPAIADQPAAGMAALPAPEFRMCCFLCNDDSDVYEMELLYVHRRCRRIVLDRLLGKSSAADATQE